jgi:PTH2 family peptidyl-tRNA hydrolase
MSISKQVIVIRTDLKTSNGHKVRTGKLIAQGAHASMKALLDWAINDGNGLLLELPSGSPLKDWVEGRFTKICVGVNSEAELLEVYNKAKAAGLICALITDAGLTEFNGVPTKTCCAIGPEWSEDIDKITGNLKLL